jgi:hypothetical protein
MMRHGPLHSFLLVAVACALPPTVMAVGRPAPVAEAGTRPALPEPPEDAAGADEDPDIIEDLLAGEGDDPAAVGVGPAPSPSAAALVGDDGVLQRLRTLWARPASGAAIRVVQLGDSHTEAGVLPSVLAYRLAGGRTVASSFLAPFSRGLRRARLTLSGAWTRSTWLQHGGEGGDGPAGHAAVTTGRAARATLVLESPAVAGTRLTVLWECPGAARPFRVVAEGRNLVAVDEADVAAAAPAATVFELPAGARTVELEVPPHAAAAALRLVGVSIDPPDAAVTYDVLGLVGASHHHPLQRDPAAVEAFLRLRKPDVVVVWFGSNSIFEAGRRPAYFEEDYGRLLDLVGRAAPQAVLVGLAPPDYAHRLPGCRPLRSVETGRRTGKWATREPGARRKGRHAIGGRGGRTKVVKAGRHRRRAARRRFPPLVCSADAPSLLSPAEGDPCRPVTPPSLAWLRGAQREALVSRGGVFFDVASLMEPEGGIGGWFCAQPALAASDLLHLTSAGYARVAAALDEAVRAVPAPMRTPSGPAPRNGVPEAHDEGED